jgi:hypothetical protein
MPFPLAAAGLSAIWRMDESHGSRRVMMVIEVILIGEVIALFPQRRSETTNVMINSNFRQFTSEAIAILCHTADIQEVEVGKKLLILARIYSSYRIDDNAHMEGEAIGRVRLINDTEWAGLDLIRFLTMARADTRPSPKVKIHEAAQASAKEMMAKK